MSPRVFVSLRSFGGLLLLCSFPGSAAASPLIENHDAVHEMFNDQELARFLDLEESEMMQHRSLGAAANPRTAGQRCSSNDHQVCEEGMDCTQLKIPFYLGQERCAPTSCFRAELLKLQQVQDIDGYNFKERVLAAAGLTEMEVLEQVRDQSNIVRGRKGSGDAFAGSTAYATLLEAMRSDPAFDAYVGVLNNCTGGNNFKQASIEEGYIGFHVEAGLILDTAVTFASTFPEFPSGNITSSFLRFCLGGEAGGGGEFSFIFGAPIGNCVPPTPASCGSVWADADLALGIGVGAAIGVEFTGIPYVEFTAGVGGGGGIGASICYSLKG